MKQPNQQLRGPLKPRAELLQWLNPNLDYVTAEGAGDLLDAVAASLQGHGPTNLFDDPPPLIFDPVKASAYRPDPVELPGSRTDEAREPDLDGLPWIPGHVLADLTARGVLTRSEVIKAFSYQIDTWDSSLNAFIRVTLDPQTDFGDSGGLLKGIPIGLQDMVCTSGIPTTAGSSILRDFVPDRDAAAWKRLKGEGAILAGKLNTQEFAAGTTGTNDHYGSMRNPWDLARTAGGAAGGAGAAVAAGLVSSAVGTDPGGSIRVPAAHCGIVGLKPTFGVMDRSGVVPLTWTTETMGVLAQTISGTASIADMLLDGRARQRYGMSCQEASARGSARDRIDLRIGVPTNWLEMGLDDGVQRAYLQALTELASLGATVHEVVLPDAAAIAPVHRAIAFSEASSIHEELIRDRATEYGQDIRQRQEAGRGVMASEYLKAARLRGFFARQFSEVWKDVDVIVTPTTPVPAAPVDTLSISTGSRGEEAAHTVYTRYAAPLNTLGLPALSVPCGFTKEGLPVGLQLCGPPHSEPLLFYVGAAYESKTPWHLRHPNHPVTPGGK